MLASAKGVIDKTEEVIAEERKKEDAKTDLLAYEEFLKIYNQDASDPKNGWNKKLIQNEFKDGMMYNIFQRK